MNNPVIDALEKEYLTKDLPDFSAGDSVKVFVKIVEGNKSRVQAFEGTVIAIQGSGVGKTFTVRKLSGGVGVERTIPYNSPNIDSITVVRKQVARRAKIGNWLRSSSKQPKLKERKNI